MTILALLLFIIGVWCVSGALGASMLLSLFYREYLDKDEVYYELPFVNRMALLGLVCFCFVIWFLNKYNFRFAGFMFRLPAEELPDNVPPLAPPHP